MSEKTTRDELSDTEKKLWSDIITYARWYDGTPETLIKMIAHLKRQGYMVTRHAKK